MDGPQIREVALQGHVKEFLSMMRHRRRISGWPILGRRTGAVGPPSGGSVTGSLRRWRAARYCRVSWSRRRGASALRTVLAVPAGTGSELHPLRS